MVKSAGRQVHYDNAAGTPGRVDSSGVRVYYTDPRPLEVSVRLSLNPQRLKYLTLSLVEFVGRD